jgi:hypothetical protein
MTSADWSLVIAMLAGWAGRETLFSWRRRRKRRAK